MISTTNLLTNFAIIMIATSLTGGALVVLWLGIGTILEKLGFINIIYELLKLVILFFILPISYLALIMFERELGRGFLFVPLSVIWEEILLILGIWGMVVVLALMALGCEVYRLNVHFKDAIPAKKAFCTVLAEVCNTLGIPLHKVELKQSYRVEIPCVTGIKRAKVILPVEEFDKETLRVVLTHELTHFKQKDMLLKRISLVVLILHFYNPLAWLLYEKIQEWSEFACDYRAYPYCSGKRHYFEVLMHIASNRSGRERLSSQLYEDRHELVERVMKLSKISKVSKRAKLSVTVVMCVAFMTSSISVYAATVQTAKAYEYLYRAYEVTLAEFDGEVVDDYVEYTESGDTPGITLIEKNVNHSGRSGYSYAWDLQARSRISAPYFDLAVGQKVLVSASIIPADVEVKVGLERNDGTRRYVLITDIGAHTFDVEVAGRYRVYIQNDSYTDVTVEGSYIIK